MGIEVKEIFFFHFRAIIRKSIIYDGRHLKEMLKNLG